MKHCILLFVCWLIVSTGFAQKIHSHNDYAQALPFVGAYEQRADFIEADVWLRDGKLVVAHDKEQVATAPTLDSLYLTPIVKLFQQNKGGRFDGLVSTDRNYTFALMIDVKDDAATVLPKLIAALQENLVCFNRQVNPKAVQVIISGNRPRYDTYVDYPAFIQFDGRPNEIYDTETLQHVALISDSFRSYSRWDGNGDLSDEDRAKLKRVIKRAHNDGKPIRFWAIPDVPNAWKQLKRLGVDVINTDKVAEAVKTIK